MLYLVLSILVVVVPIIIFYSLYLNSLKELKEIEYELELQKQISENLEKKFYQILNS